MGAFVRSLGIQDFDFVERVVQTAGDVRSGFGQLLDYCAAKHPGPAWNEIRALDVESDLGALREWLEGVLTAESPSPEVSAFWFGLFNPCDDDGEVTSCLYLAGSDRFDPADDTGEWAVDPAYFPEGACAPSQVLAQLYRIAAAHDEETLEIADYVLSLGYAGLVVRSLAAEMDPALLLGTRESRAVVVGFDSGDFILLGTMQRDGLALPR